MSALSYTTKELVKVRLGLGTAVNADDDLIDDLVEEVNSDIEQYVWRQIGPSNGGTATFDAALDVFDGRLQVRQGIRSVTSMTVAPSTSSDPVSVTVADLVILPRTQNRKPDWPGFEIALKDAVVGAVSHYGYGYGTITLVGDFGWADIPPNLRKIATTLAIREWHARKSGQTDIIGSDANGEPLVSRHLSLKDQRALKAYRPAGGLVAG